MPKIFVSYRRDDNKAFVERIHDRLATAFGKENVFQDVDNGIVAGTRWKEVLKTRLDESDILLVVIGKHWERIINERVSIPNDWVRFEIEQGLTRGKNFILIPLLIEDTPFPSKLPNSIRDLSEYQVFRVRGNPDFNQDTSKLIDIIVQYGKPLEEPIPAPLVSERPNPVKLSSVTPKPISSSKSTKSNPVKPSPLREKTVVEKRRFSRKTFLVFLLSLSFFLCIGLYMNQGLGNFILSREDFQTLQSRIAATNEVALTLISASATAAINRMVNVATEPSGTSSPTTSTYTPTPTISPTPPGLCRVEARLTSGINMREEPNVNSARLRILEYGTPMDVLDIAHPPAGLSRYWLYVRVDTLENQLYGWVRDDTINELTDCPVLPN